MNDDLLGADQRIPTAYLPKGEATTLAPGTIIQNRYEIDRVIGIGGMGAVYRVRDTRFKDAVKWDALKEMIIKFADHLDQQTRMRNFEREANLLASLNHHLIPKVNDFFFEANRAYLVLDYIQGKNLEDVLMEAIEAKQFLDEQQVAGWAMQICEVLDYLHSFRPLPVIFRDLKPSNVMLTPQNQTMLIDFGIAKIIQPQRRDTMIGTEGYSPPEQYKGSVDPRSDIYALGAMLHQLLTASDPRMETPFTFHERPPRQLNPNISPEMEALVMKCLAYQSDQRWQSAAELHEALQHVLQLHSLAGSGQLLRPPPPQPQAPAPSPQQNNGHRTGMLDYSAAALPKVTGVFHEVDDIHYPPDISKQAIPSNENSSAVIAPSPPVMNRPGNWSTSSPYVQVGSAVPSPTLLWSFETEEEVRSSPTLAHNTLYVGSYDYNLYALDAGTGTFKWKFATEGRICSTPACVGDIVIVGSEDHNVYARHGQNNTEIWTYHTWNPVQSSPRIVQDMVVVGSDDGCVHAMDLHSGRQVWKFKTWREVRSAAAHAQGTIYIGSDDEYVYAVEASTGREKWKFHTQNRVCSSPVVSDDMVYVGSMDGTLYALDAALGWPAWRHYTNDYIIASPTLSEGRVYIGSVDKNFYCLDAKTRRQLWKFPAGGQITSSAAVAGGFVYFGCNDGAVYGLDARTGQLRWKFQTNGPVPSSPLVREGVLYIGSNDHYVYALRCAI